ncbi:MAG: alkaline phosphatase D family protein [Longimicrobiales bacterium]
MNHRGPPLFAILLLTPSLLFADLGCVGPDAGEVELSWEGVPDRPWAGPKLWANRIQDWEVKGERLESSLPLPLRTAFLLTLQTDPDLGDLSITAEMGLGSPGATVEGEGSGGEASAGNEAAEEAGPAQNTGIEAEQGSARAEGGATMRELGAAGILLGAGGRGLDPRRRTLIHHSSGPGGGLFLGLDETGHLFLSDLSRENTVLARSTERLERTLDFELRVQVVPEGSGARIRADVSPGDAEAGSLSLDAGVFPRDRLAGGMALVSHAPKGDDPRGWFKRVRVQGDAVVPLEDGDLGPILGAQHTLSRGTLRLTAQLFPLWGPLDGSGPGHPDSVRLEVQEEGGRWVEATLAPVFAPGYTATMQVGDWPVERPVPYRLTYVPGPGRGEGGLPYQGTIRPEPAEKDQIVVAAFTGNHNVASPGVDQGAFDWLQRVWFPHEDIVTHVEAHAPDFLFFSGDQVYEGASPTAADFDHPYGDYLYKWYLWLWAFRDLTRDIPSVAIPDDHDVFHGNVWGAGGRRTPAGLSGAEAQDQGGYKLPPEWVNMVQRTQASHLPEPRVPEASDHGVDVYFTDILYGGVSFAVLEDRKFKSPPKLLLPEADVWNGWAQNPDFDAAARADAPGASLLGEAQEAFLEAWAGEWQDGTWMKVVLSQTIFANVATIPADASSGSVIPSLPIPEPGAWVAGDKMAADMDSNGWPQSGRNRALGAMRKGFAVHLAGDQHLASTIQYGVEDWGDGPFALCVPSVANFWPRRWYPPAPGGNRPPGAPSYAGEFRDGFGNRITVFAVSNPALWGREPELLHNRAPGYGIARFHRRTREVSLEAWPRWADPRKGDAPYPGWPVRFRQEDGYGRVPWGYLPTLETVGMEDPVVQVVSEAGGEVVYTLRIRGERFTPRVFEAGTYTLRVGEPGTSRWRVFLGQTPSPDSSRTLEVAF